MYKITNIETLGTEYTVADQNGKIIKTIQIIPSNEILDAALGPYTESFGNLSSYLEKSVAVLEGNEHINPLSVYWHSTEDAEISLDDVIEYAIKFGYDVVILEHIDPVDH